MYFVDPATSHARNKVMSLTLISDITSSFRRKCAPGGTESSKCAPGLPRLEVGLYQMGAKRHQDLKKPKFF